VYYCRSQMNAVLLTRHGSADVLHITEVPKPEPRAGEVCVRVRYIGINFAEVLSRRGVYSWAPRLPYILGMEAFGELDGEPVIVGTKSGAYAEWICVPREQVLQPPRGFTPQECAAFAVNYLTAWVGLMEMARLRASDKLLVTSAAGGVGMAALQIGVTLGARVIGVARDGKQDAIRKLGAEALTYDDALPDDADVVLEMKGIPVRTAPLGRIVYAGASAALPRTRNPFARLAALRRLSDMLRHSYGVMSFHVGWLLESGAIRKQWRDLVAFVEQHGIRPVAGHELPFARIADGHRLLEEGRNTGKVIVKV
jgi:NADPH:quinone reductase-like Zn-dependent oxidoreductase